MTELDDNNNQDSTLGGKDQAAVVADLQPNTRLGRYFVLSKHGTGGMGVVYKAYDPELDRRVALKVLGAKRSGSDLSGGPHARLLREAQAMAQLSHPNVVAVYDVGTFDDSVFIAMEFVEGQTLRAWLKQPDRTLAQKLEVFVVAGRGLSAAHKANLVHRDFKPDNVIISEDGRVRVLDFGLARAATENPESPRPLDIEVSSGDSNINSERLLGSNLTSQGALVGTPAYMSPEQLLGLTVDSKSDQFSFCVALYEALFGKRPFSGKWIKQILSNILTSKLERIESIQAGSLSNVPLWLFQILTKGLHIDPAQRFRDMDELLDALCDDPDQARLQRRKRIRRAILTGSAILLAALIPIMIFSFFSNQNDQLCKNGNLELEQVWNENSQQRMRYSFSNLNRAYAMETFSRVKQNLDQFGKVWIDMNNHACAATHIHGTQSERLLDLQMGCLRSKLNKMKAIISVLTSSLDTKMLDKSIQASLSLEGLEHCADSQALSAAFPPPEKRILEQVEALQQKLDQIEAMDSAGAYQAGLNPANDIAKDCNDTGYKPLIARHLCILGSLQESAGEYKKAAATFDRAILATAESMDFIDHAKAWSNLIWIEAIRLDHFDTAMAYKRAAEVSITLAGQDPLLRGKLLLTLASVLDFHGDSGEAQTYYNKALNAFKQSGDDQRADIATTYNSFAMMKFYQGEFNQAMDLYKKAFAIWERIYGPSHPNVAYSYNNIAFVFLELGEFSEAEPLFVKADAIWEMASGPESQLLAWTQQGLGWIQLHLNEFSRAQRHFERAIAICEARGCGGYDQRPYSRALFGLSQVLFRDAKKKKRAIRLARRALELSASFSTPLLKKHSQQITDWLTNADKADENDSRLRPILQSH